MKKIFIAILFLLVACNGWAATYYVKTGGNDSAAGTSDGTAWAHCPGMAGWTGGVSPLVAGDTVYFREGDTWEGADSNGYTPVLQTQTGVSYYGLGYGTAGTRAILRTTSTSAVQPHVGVVNIIASNVTIDGFEIDADQKFMGGIYIGMYLGSTIQNIIVNNCIVHDVGDPSSTVYIYGIIVGNTDYTHGYVAQNITLTNNTVYNTAHEGIAIYPSRHYGCWVDNVLLRNNVVHDTGLKLDASYGQGIFIANHATNITAEFNTVYNAYAGFTVTTYNDYFETPETIHDETYPHGVGFPTPVTLRYNYIYSLYSGSEEGIHIKPVATDYTGWGNVYVYGNIVSNAEIYLAGANFWDQTNVIYNNTVYNNSTNIYAFRIYKTATNTDGVVVKNNILYTNNFTAYHDEGGLLSATQHMYNLIFRHESGTAAQFTTTTYTTANVKNFEETAQNTNPSVTGGDLPTGFSGTYGTNMVPNTTYFAITSGDALGNGAVLSSPYNKAINNAGTDSTYTRGTAWDIGAYEYTLDGGATIVNTGAVFSGCTF